MTRDYTPAGSEGRSSFDYGRTRLSDDPEGHIWRGQIWASVGMIAAVALVVFVAVWFVIPALAVVAVGA